MNAPFISFLQFFWPTMNTVHRNSQRMPTVLIHTFNGKWISKKKSNVWLGWNLKLNGQECLSTLKQRRGQNNVVILSFVLYKDPTHATNFLNLSNSLSYLSLSLFPLSLTASFRIRYLSLFFFWTSCLLLISITVSLELCYMIWSSSLSSHVHIKYFLLSKSGRRNSNADSSHNEN
ncbi:hypothetical protein ACB092_05G242700 [Castanea dentata]